MPEVDLKVGELRDCVRGATGGAVAALIIVAAVAGAGLPAIVASVLGLVTLFANGLATAAWRYVRARSLAKMIAGIDPTNGHDHAWYMRLAGRGAFSAFTAFLLCGLVPLIANVLAPTNLGVPMVATACILLAIGAVKSHYLTAAWWRPEPQPMLLGTSAAALAYATAHTMRLVLDMPPP